MTTPINGMKTADQNPRLEYMGVGRPESTAMITEPLPDQQRDKSLVDGGLSGRGRSARWPRVTHRGSPHEKKLRRKALILAKPLV
jgi:hypothetical protein